MDHLKGKVILISGGAHGQGAAEAAYSPRKEPGSSSRMCLSRRVASLHPNLVMQQRSSVKM